jgi:N-carbamoylputrescine amidase
VDSRRHWQRTQQGHAAANLVPLIAANRIGIERSRLTPDSLWLRFYGSSFIANEEGALLAEASDDREEVIFAAVDLDAVRTRRDGWFVFRDRRPDLYGLLATRDGNVAHTAGAPAE